MDPIAVIREKLKKYPDARFEERPGSITIPASTKLGFDVSLSIDGREFTVAFGGWHEEFSGSEEALECFAFGLSTSCRLRVDYRGNFPHRWTVEYREDGKWQADSTTGLMFYPFWRRARTIYLQNELISG